MSSSVPAFPRVEILKANRYRLTDDYIYDWEHEGTRYRLVVPRDFLFDLGSVPRIFWPLVSPMDLAAASVPHDWIYRHQGKLPEGSYQRLDVKEEGNTRTTRWEDITPDRYVWTRKDTDRLFGRMLRESHVVRWRRRAAYLAVRLLGLPAWLS